MSLHLSLLPHLLDFHVIICCNRCNCDDQSSKVYRCKFIVKDNCRRYYGEDFFEYTADTQGDDRSALKEGEFGGGHEEGEGAGE